MYPKRHDHIETENKYELFREVTYETVMEQFPERDSCKGYNFARRFNRGLLENN